MLILLHYLSGFYQAVGAYILSQINFFFLALTWL